MRQLRIGPYDRMMDLSVDDVSVEEQDARMLNEEQTGDSMQRIKSIAWYVGLNGALAVSVFYGVVEQNVGMANVAMFAVWVMFAMSAVVAFTLDSPHMADNVTKIATRKSVPRWIDGSFDAAITVTFIYHGWFVYGAVYAIHSLLMVSIQNSAKKLHAERTAAEKG